MLAKDLAEILLQYPHYEVLFKFTDDNNKGFAGSPEIRSFDDIKLHDINYCNETLVLSGLE